VCPSNRGCCSVKYFTKVKVSAVAAMKMVRFLLLHAAEDEIPCTDFFLGGGGVLSFFVFLVQTSHASAGVEKGLAAKNAMPIEIMGLMTGTIDTEEEGVLIINDVFPLPVEGTETRVMSDSDEVIGYMTRLSDAIEVRAVGARGYHLLPKPIATFFLCSYALSDRFCTPSVPADSRDAHFWLVPFASV
jgi:hypothetical protein